MKAPSYVVKVPGSGNWHYKRDVPPDIRAALGGKPARWRHSLGTSVLREASIEAARLTHKYNELIRVIRAKAQLSPEEQAQIEEAGGEGAFVEQVSERLRAAEGAESGARYIHSIAELDGPVTGSDPFAVAARELLASTRSAAPSPSEARAKIAGLQAEAESLREEIAQDAPLVAKLQPASGLTTKLGDLPSTTQTATLGSVLAAWEKVKKPRNFNQYSVPIREFESLHGRKLLTQLKKEHVRQFRDHLAAKGLKESTASKHFRCLKSIFSFAVEDGYIDASPAAAVRWIWKKRKFSELKEESRRTLTVDELNRLLGVCDTLPKNNHAKQDAAWFIRLALWTGGRPEELCQLTHADIAKVSGVMCVRIRDLLKYQKIKNQSSMRDVPIHKALIDMGFIQFVEARKNQRLIFSTLKADGRERLYSRMQRRCSRLMRNQAKITDPRVVVYSFRHMFKDCLRRIDAPQYIADRLMGHTSPGRRVADGYGGAQVENLNKWLQQIDLFDKGRTVSGFKDEEAPAE
ncbi:site-specific integrase [Methylocystis heyeri]|uniref:Tyrosine-type recombinase/integrase n=1 Tax=Methylocystis heyeri TaxID=391905 RepID=A0A6B8KFV0_9HYPH|nr:site-specific integrase [Methylocystis heyeri]QGM46479.1 tyrosine-type recombinase/integrase [Methylocystis heyeri]